MTERTVQYLGINSGEKYGFNQPPTGDWTTTGKTNEYVAYDVLPDAGLRCSNGSEPNVLSVKVNFTVKTVNPLNSLDDLYADMKMLGNEVHGGGGSSFEFISQPTQDQGIFEGKTTWPDGYMTLSKFLTGQDGFSNNAKPFSLYIYHHVFSPEGSPPSQDETITTSAPSKAEVVLSCSVEVADDLNPETPESTTTSPQTPNGDPTGDDSPDKSNSAKAPLTGVGESVAVIMIVVLAAIGYMSYKTYRKRKDNTIEIVR